MLRVNCEANLPEDYREVYRTDATNPRVGAAMNLIGLLPLALTLSPVLLRYSFDDILASPYSIHAFFLLAVALLGYIVLHKLIHGLVYKLMTGQRLTFDMSPSCFFCGVPNTYVYRHTALFAYAAPFVLFTLLLTPLFIAAYLYDSALAVVSAILLGLHLGGCVGDLYVCVLLLCKYRNKALLVRDTGPRQSFYLPQAQPADGACSLESITPLAPAENSYDIQP